MRARTTTVWPPPTHGRVSSSWFAILWPCSALHWIRSTRQRCNDAYEHTVAYAYAHDLARYASCKIAIVERCRWKHMLTVVPMCGPSQARHLASRGDDSSATPAAEQRLADCRDELDSTRREKKVKPSLPPHCTRTLTGATTTSARTRCSPHTAPWLAQSLFANLFVWVCTALSDHVRSCSGEDDASRNHWCAPTHCRQAGGSTLHCRLAAQPYTVGWRLNPTL